MCECESVCVCVRAKRKSEDTFSPLFKVMFEGLDSFFRVKITFSAMLKLG